jgi:homoserine/homoserine lactone efflux protein
MSVDTLIAYVVAMLIVSLSPGSGCMLTLSTALTYGFGKTWPAILGLQLGLMIQLALVGIGLGALIAEHPWAFDVLQWAGVLYLAWIGVNKLLHPAIALQLGSSQVMRRTLLTRALWVNLLNPKAFVFLAAFFPQFINPLAALAPQYLTLATLTVVIDVVVMCLYAWLAHQVRPFFNSPEWVKLQDRIFGGLFVVAAMVLAVIDSGGEDL